MDDNLFQKILSSALTCAFIIGTDIIINTGSIAAPLIDRAYAQYSFNAPNAGGEITLVFGQEDLINSSTATQKIGSINKEMWVSIGQNNVCWIEAGQKKGEQIKDLKQPDLTPQTINWSGHFIGYYLYNTQTKDFEFHGTPYGASNPTGKHTYRIALTNSPTGQWTVYVNGYTALTLTGVRCQGSSTEISSASVTVGIESKDTTNSFKNGTYMTDWKIYDSRDFKWKLVTSAVQEDVNVYNGMKSYFRYIATPTPSNQVTFNHN